MKKLLLEKKTSSGKKKLLHLEKKTFSEKKLNSIITAQAQIRAMLCSCNMKILTGHPNNFHNTALMSLSPKALLEWLDADIVPRPVHGVHGVSHVGKWHDKDKQQAMEGGQPVDIGAITLHVTEDGARHDPEQNNEAPYDLDHKKEAGPESLRTPSDDEETVFWTDDDDLNVNHPVHSHDPEKNHSSPNDLEPKRMTEHDIFRYPSDDEPQDCITQSFNLLTDKKRHEHHPRRLGKTKGFQVVRDDGGQSPFVFFLDRRDIPTSFHPELQRCDDSGSVRRGGGQARAQSQPLHQKKGKEKKVPMGSTQSFLKFDSFPSVWRRLCPLEQLCFLTGHWKVE